MSENPVVPLQQIENLILVIRGRKVMLDKDLAVLYGVSTSVLNKAVTRNMERFPPDFMFRLSKKEFSDLKFHFGTSSWGGTRKLPRVFTEQGVAMLSSVLRSQRAVQVNISIMRVFVRLRETMATHKKLAQKLLELESHVGKHDQQIQTIFDVIHALIEEPKKNRRKIGFEVNEPKRKYSKNGG